MSFLFEFNLPLRGASTSSEPAAENTATHLHHSTWRAESLQLPQMLENKLQCGSKVPVRMGCALLPPVHFSAGSRAPTVRNNQMETSVLGPCSECQLHIPVTCNFFFVTISTHSHFQLHESFGSNIFKILHNSSSSQVLRA